MPFLPLFRRRSDPLLLVVDAVTAAMVCFVALRLRGDAAIPLSASEVHDYRWATVVLVVVWCAACRYSGLYRRAALRLSTSNVEPAFGAALATGGLLLVADVTLFSGELAQAWIALVV